MQDMGADIPKIAVMPRSAGDVLTLLSATEEMARCYADRPIITMSMSSQGVVSRLCGEVFGSSMTFGAVGQVSAPGQIPVDQLRQVLEILHGSSVMCVSGALLFLGRGCPVDDTSSSERPAAMSGGPFLCIYDDWTARA